MAPLTGPDRDITRSAVQILGAAIAPVPPVADEIPSTNGVDPEHATV